MSDASFRPVLAGQKALVIGVANDKFDRLRMREGLSRPSAPSSPLPG